MIERTIKKNDDGQRFDKYLKKLLKEVGSSFIYKMLRKKNITLNGKKADGSEKVREGDMVRLFFSDETYAKFIGNTATAFGTQNSAYEKLPRTDLSILYEDEEILVINKPAGMLSQKAKPTDVSANEYLLSYLLDTNAVTPQELETFRPSICNRLDRNTSGLLVAGKTLHGLQAMSKLLQERTVKKYYCCLVRGNLKKEQKISGYLWKDEAKNRVMIHASEKPGAKRIETAYRPLKIYGNVTLLEVHLITGRSHQIRAHLASIGHPILGDMKYGDAVWNDSLRKHTGIRNQLLHASRMEFPDVKILKAPLPEEFQKAMDYFEGEK